MPEASDVIVDPVKENGSTEKISPSVVSLASYEFDERMLEIPVDRTSLVIFSQNQ